MKSTKDAATLAILASLNLRNEEPLTPEQEQMLQNALDPNDEFYEELLKIFKAPKQK